MPSSLVMRMRMFFRPLLLIRPAIPSGQAFQAAAFASIDIACSARGESASGPNVPPKFPSDNRQAVRGRTNTLRLLRVTQRRGCSSVVAIRDGEWR